MEFLGTIKTFCLVNKGKSVLRGIRLWKKSAMIMKLCFGGPPSFAPAFRGSAGLSVFGVFIGGLLLITGLSSAGYAQELNYREALIDALRHSPNLQMRTEDIRIAEAQYKAGFAGLLPSITLSGRAERYENLDSRSASGIDTIGNEVVGGNQTAWRSSVNVTGQYYFSHWYKKRYEVKHYEQLKDAGIEQCGAEVKKVIREVTDLYGALVEANIKLYYARRVLKLLNDILRIKKESYAVGHFSFEDVLKAEADAGSADKEVARVGKEITDLLHRLAGYTGGEYSEDTLIEPIVFQGVIDPVDEKKAATEAPEYRAKLSEMKAARAKTTAAQNNLLPDISVYGRYDLFNSSPESLDASLRDTRPSSYSAGILISVPLFDGGARYWEWRKNRSEVRRQEEGVRAAYEERNKEIRTIHDGYRHLMRSYDHLKKLRKQYDQLTALSKKARLLGDRSVLDMLELEKDTLSVESDLKATEHSLAVYERKMELERDYHSFLREYDGNWACSY